MTGILGHARTVQLRDEVLFFDSRRLRLSGTFHESTDKPYKERDSPSIC